MVTKISVREWRNVKRSSRNFILMRKNKNIHYWGKVSSFTPPPWAKVATHQHVVGGVAEYQLPLPGVQSHALLRPQLEQAVSSIVSECCCYTSGAHVTQVLLMLHKCSVFTLVLSLSALLATSWPMARDLPTSAAVNPCIGAAACHNKA